MEEVGELVAEKRGLNVLDDFLSHVRRISVAQQMESLILPREIARPVLWDGEIDSVKLIVVGEAPGIQEQIEGKPFVGRSGKLLRGLLHGYVLKQKKMKQYFMNGRGLFITNPIFYLPVSSSSPVDISRARGIIRAPTDGELDSMFSVFSSILDYAISRSPHDVIWVLAVGNTGGRAVYAYLNNTVPSQVGADKIKNIRNTVHFYKKNGKVILFGVIYHPSFFLRRGVSYTEENVETMLSQLRSGNIDLNKNYLAYLVFVTSRMLYLDQIFSTAHKMAQQYKNQEIEYHIITGDTTAEELQSILVDMDSDVAFDTELKKIHGEVSSLSWDHLNISDLSLFDGRRALYFNTDALRKFSKQLYDFFLTDRKWIAHNALFDLVVLQRYFSQYGFTDWLYRFKFKKVRDTMVGWHLLNEEDRKGLKYLVPLLLDTEMQEFKDADKLRHTRMWVDYSLQDSIQAWRLWQVEKVLLKKFNLAPVFLREMSAFGSVAAMVVNGMLVDTDRLDTIGIEIEERINQLELEMHRIYWDLLQQHGNDKGLGRYINLQDQAPRPKINFNSPIQLSQIIYDLILFKHCGVDRSELEKRGIKVKKSGILPTDKKAIDKLMDLDNTGFLKKLNEYRKLFKLKSSYIIPLRSEHIQSDGKVHGWFKPTGTKTGRFSSENPNLQQIPAEDEYGLRGLFIAPSGWKIAAIDYSGQELRLAAIASGERTMIEAFKKGQDLHLTTAKQAFNLPIPDEVLVESHPEYKQYKEKFKHERKKAKAVNFGVIYGITAKGLSEQIKSTEEEAQKIIDSYFASKPDLARAIKQTYRELVLQSYVTNIFGRQRHFTKLSDASFRQAFNFKIQSAGADIMKHVLGRLWDEIFVPFRDRIRPLATVHDEIVLLVREDSLDLVNKVKQIMEDWNFPVKMEVDAGLGDSYGEAK